MKQNDTLVRAKAAKKPAKAKKPLVVKTGIKAGAAKQIYLDQNHNETLVRV
jgi:hypothetical protein